MFKWIRAVLLAAAMAAAGACRDVPERPKTAPPPVATSVESDDVVAVTRQWISTGPPISGELRAAREVTVRAEVAGSVIGLTAEEGQPVRRGQVLCRIDAHALQSAVDSARVAVNSARHAVEVARGEEQRTAALVEEGLVPRRDLELARKGIADAEAQLAEAHARFTAAGEQSANSVVRAPLGGVVSTRTANAGDVVAPGAPLLTIIDPSTMQLEASVSSEALADLRVGAPVEFRIDGYGAYTFNGRIDRINPAADPVTRQVQIYVSVLNASRRLVAGLFAEGRVAAASRRGLVVPATAVDMNGEDPWVLRLRDGRTERVPVALGLRDEQQARVEIRLGLAEGDLLLSGAGQLIAPGTPVSVERESRSAAAR
jgi:RND family efflux transporter MFP subunit